MTEQQQNKDIEKEKLIVRKATVNLKRKYGRTKQISIVERDAFIPRSIEDDIKAMISKKKNITATEIAARFDVRVSAVKLLLRQYEEEGLIKLYDPSLKLKIYIPVKK
ncbi:MAG: hypothetical protein ACTSR8_03730 [Promethearchaeota archaeon]